ncbi:protein XRI1 isoform X1 [Tripterygium wilfordii]|uniref:protein XRI1 isoform X1 n=2 Tax=Tripterygium wilfordii TaxID=458696 RepID=UPI0018F8139B|nr:protein XRI1 isoform X1 [Tripterygium wilfordii]
MDYNCNSGEHWNWQGDGSCPRKDSNYADVSKCCWNEITLNEEDISYMLDDQTTPMKASGDLHVTHCENINKDPEQCREASSQVKRRRMLQFDTEVVDSLLCSEEIPSVFLKSNERKDSFEEVLPQVSEWVSGFSEHVSASSYKGLDQSSEEWLAECFNDTQLNFLCDDMNYAGAADIQIDFSELYNCPTETENVVRQQVTRTPRNIVFKGRKSIKQTPTKLASSVTSPFTFIKPCGVHGDVTLKDINQKIHTPPKSKQNYEDPAVYPTSPFSGKPVVGKTKIRTDGGKGSSITIMRTKG